MRVDLNEYRDRNPPELLSSARWPWPRNGSGRPRCPFPQRSPMTRAHQLALPTDETVEYYSVAVVLTG